MSDTEDYRRSDAVLSAAPSRDRFPHPRSSSTNSDNSYSADVSMAPADPPASRSPSYADRRPSPIDMETAHHSKHELSAPVPPSPASSKSESIDVPTPTDSEKNLMNMVTTLHSTVMGMQNTLSGAYQTMLGNLTQSVQMMQMMHSMMEDFVRRSLLVETHVLPFSHAKETVGAGVHVPAGQVSPSTVLLHLQLTNAGHFPVRGLMLNLYFSLPPNTPNLATGAAPSSDIKFQLLSYHMSPQSRVQAELDEIKIANEIPQVATIDSEIPVIKTPIALNPGSSLTLRVLMTPPRFARFNGSMTISFPSPGTAQSLSLQHRFGVYLMHQCQMRFHPAGAVPSDLAAIIPSDSDPAHTARLSAVALRAIFRVAPLHGLSAGSVFHLTGPAPGAQVIFRVDEPDGDNHVRARFVESHPSAFAARDVVEETEKMANYFSNSNHNSW